MSADNDPKTDSPISSSIAPGEPCLYNSIAMPRAFRYIWAFPTTLVGLVFVIPTLLTGGRVQAFNGVLEVSGGLTKWFLRHCTVLPGGALAMTLGHVILGVDRPALDVARRHERIHVEQCERWGPFFIPAYLLASVWTLLRGRNAYRHNPFEREAYERAPVDYDPVFRRREGEALHPNADP